jgi:NifB/MoaA-like Fe-S oxidoreductase
MKYESMPRAELIAELKAWENKCDEIVKQKEIILQEKYKEKDEELYKKYEDSLKMTAEEKYKVFWLANDTISNFAVLPERCEYLIWRANNDEYSLEYYFKKLKEAYDKFDKLYKERKNDR